MPAQARSSVAAIKLRPDEKLGQDIVYLKGDLGPVATEISSGTFWVLNIVRPSLRLAGAIGWKRRTDRLRGDVAYARRSRAAKNAHKLLAAATNCDEIQRALQNYLGDRLNIPASGITASVAEEHRLPAEVADVFQTCDAARFAGAQADLTALKQTVERVIDELENYSSVVCLSPFPVFADDFKAANALYDAGKFAEAAAAYEKIEPKTAHVFYNLGNALFREDKLGSAILNYERARQLAPRDPDILANLKFAEQRLGVDDVNTPPGASRVFCVRSSKAAPSRNGVRYELVATLADRAGGRVCPFTSRRCELD